MVPAQTPLAQDGGGSEDARLACIEMVHGAAGSTVDGSRQTLLVARKGRRAISSSRQTLEPLEPFRDYITIVSDTDLSPARRVRRKEEGATISDQRRVPDRARIRR